MATVFLRGKTYYGKFQHRGRPYRPCLDTTNKRVAVARLQKMIARPRPSVI